MGAMGRILFAGPERRGKKRAQSRHAVIVRAMSITAELSEVARVRVIYGDTDQMGMVYYGNYLRYFEIARNEFLRRAGAPYRAFEETHGLRAAGRRGARPLPAAGALRRRAGDPRRDRRW